MLMVSCEVEDHYLSSCRSNSNGQCLSQWLSATYLLQDRLDYPADDDAFANVERRLEHFLRTKIEYGYYEWFSTNYM